MPHKTWVHKCRKNQGSAIWRGVEICPNCGEHGKYDGWHFSMIEAMGAYERRTGFKPIGPHRTSADMLLNPFMKVCKECKGKGVIDIELGEDWKICSTCDGAQYLFDGTEEELNRLHIKILSVFPDAKSA